MLYILIQKCSSNSYWYKNKVGQTIPLVRQDDEYFWAREDAGYINIVAKTDAIIVELTVSEEASKIDLSKIYVD